MKLPMQFLWNVRAWVAIPFVMMYAGCITDSQIRREVDERGGILIETEGQTNLIAANGVIRVGIDTRNEFEQPSIALEHVGGQGCPEYCWEQIIRTHVNTWYNTLRIADPLENLSPSAITGSRALEKRQSERSYEGWHVDSFDATPETCIRGRTSSYFFDDPGFGDGLFEGSQRVVVWEFETCVRCKGSTDYLGCVKWFYVKVKRNEVQPESIFLITTGQVEPRPSGAFEETMRRWRVPP